MCQTACSWYEILANHVKNILYFPFFRRTRISISISTNICIHILAVMYIMISLKQTEFKGCLAISENVYTQNVN